MSAPLPELMDARKLATELGEHYIYVLDCDHGVKVGITVDVAGRLNDMERASGQRPILIRVFPINRTPAKGTPRGLYRTAKQLAYEVEQLAHWYLRADRISGEWFHCHPFDATEAVTRAMRDGVPLEYLRRDGLAA